MGAHIFICYSRVDSVFADQLASDLESKGYQVWIDQSINRGSTEWLEENEHKLRNAQEVIVIISEASIASRWVEHFGSLAADMGKKIIPLAVSPSQTFPIWAIGKQFVACYSEDGYPEALETLADRLFPPPADLELLLDDIRGRLSGTVNDAGLGRLQLEVEAILRQYPKQDQPQEARNLLEEIKKQVWSPASPRAMPGKRRLPKWVWIVGMLICLLTGLLPILFRGQIATALFPSSTPTPTQTSASRC